VLMILIASILLSTAYDCSRTSPLGFSFFVSQINAINQTLLSHCLTPIIIESMWSALSSKFRTLVITFPTQIRCIILFLQMFRRENCVGSDYAHFDLSGITHKGNLPESRFFVRKAGFCNLSKIQSREQATCSLLWIDMCFQEHETQRLHAAKFRLVQSRSPKSC
jgi:hypothetical protein